MDLAGNTLMVIGGGGFIGSHIVEELLHSEAKSILVFDNFSRGRRDYLDRAFQDSRVRVIEGDITQTDVLADAMREVDGVFHLAALWLLHCHDYPRSAFEVNIKGTFNVLESCIANKVQRLVYSSSASVYGDAVHIPMTEEHVYNNRTFYGATKIAGEHMCRAMSERYGLSYVGLRYMNVYGARQDYKGAYIAVIMKILDSLDRGEAPVLFGDGTQEYDFVYVTDVAKANVRAMQASVSDRFYNVGSGEGHTLRELTELILELTGSDTRIRYEPTEQSFVTKRIGDPEKAAAELGFRSTIRLREGLQRLIEWRRHNQEQLGMRVAAK